MHEADVINAKKNKTKINEMTKRSISSGIGSKGHQRNIIRMGVNISENSHINIFVSHTA